MAIAAVAEVWKVPGESNSHRYKVEEKLERETYNPENLIPENWEDLLEDRIGKGS